MKWLAAIALSVLGFMACSSDNDSKNDSSDSISFVKGADISWLTEMEQMGVSFRNSNNDLTDCFVLMKEIGMNAIRLRVWVNPIGGWCAQEDVISKAIRAKNAGLDVMIDFHYSDWWADPGKQNKPEAWKSMDVPELKVAIADHTNKLLSALKAKGVTPKWVQIGNETRNGMLWPEGQLWNETGNLNHWTQYAEMSNAGYDAVKSVFADALVIVHIDNAWEDNDWWFSDFKAAGGKWDMIGLSHYPQTHATKTWKEMNTLCANHVRALGNKYKTPVMICEIGTKQVNEVLAAQVMNDFMNAVKSLNQCAGVFYWEPQVYGGWKPAIYDDYGWDGYDMGAFTNDGKPAAALNAFK